MFSFFKDIPFINALGPIAVVGVLWVGINIISIGPNLVAPRLSDKTWMPACERGVIQANARAEQIRASEVDAFLAARRAEQQRVESLMNPLMMLMGDEFALTIGKSLNDSVGALVEIENQQAVRARFGDTSPAPAMGADYCTCIIDDLLQDNIALGLYSASLRLWKPASIRQLDQLETTLITSDRCGS